MSQAQLTIPTTTARGSVGLVPDSGRPTTILLGLRFARSELQAALARLLRAIGLRRLHAIVPEDWAIPDSELARRSLAYAQTVCPELVIRHCLRSYCFGAILAARNQLRLDRELLFVAAMLHDLGVSDAHRDDPGSFEWVGARLAHTFCRSEGRSEIFAETVHNSIALHTSVGIAGDNAPEIALLHYGTGMDLFGMRLDEVPRENLEEVLSRHPRDEFKKTFRGCLEHQATAKPESQIAASVGIGITDRILDDLRR